MNAPSDIWGVAVSRVTVTPCRVWPKGTLARGATLPRGSFPPTPPPPPLLCVTTCKRVRRSSAVVDAKCATSSCVRIAAFGGIANGVTAEVVNAQWTAPMRARVHTRGRKRTFENTNGQRVLLHRIFLQRILRQRRRLHVVGHTRGCDVTVQREQLVDLPLGVHLRA
jgi:hypothetical protein